MNEAPDIPSASIQNIAPQLRQLAVNISSIVLDPANARKHNQANIESIKGSLALFGQRKPIVVREDGRVVIAGNGTVQAARELGWTHIAAVMVNDDTAMATAYGIADNRTAELAEWNDDILGQLISGLQATDINLNALGFTDQEIATLVSNIDADLTNGDANDIPQERAETVSQRGEIYELGPHSLMCGDSTCDDDWQMLLGSQLGDAVMTDPPYGVSYIGGTSDSSYPDPKNGDVVENDDEEGLADLVDASLSIMKKRSKPGAVWYVAAPSGRQHLVFSKWMIENGIFRQVLIWNKSSFVFGHCDYQYKHEWIYYGWNPGGPHLGIKDRTQTTVWDFDRPSRSEDHPTMKPVELYERMMNNSTLRGQIILEPFGGSGTTLIAAARTGRICRAMEIAPRYCDVIRRRWTKFATENNIDPGSGALV